MQRTVLFSQRIVLSCRGQCCSLKGLCYAEDSVVLVLSCRGKCCSLSGLCYHCRGQCCSLKWLYCCAEDSCPVKGLRRCHVDDSVALWMDLIILQRTVLFSQGTVLSYRGQCCSVKRLCYDSEGSVALWRDCVIIQRTVLFCQRIVLSCRGQCCSLKGLCYHAADSVLAVKRTLGGGQEYPVFPSFLEAQCCHLIPLSYLLSVFCLVLFRFQSSHFSANNPFSWLVFLEHLNCFVPSRLLLYGSCWAARKWQLVEDSLSICFLWFLFQTGFLGMALVEQLGNDSW